MTKSTTFRQQTANGGRYFWDDPSNFDGGLPIDGDSVTVGTVGYDDIGSLHLAALTELSNAVAGTAGVVYVTNGTLLIDQLTLTGSNEILADTRDSAVPNSVATVTIDTITETGLDAQIGAIGRNAILIDLSTTDPGLIYSVSFGGRIDLHCALSANSQIRANTGAAGTVALYAPGLSIVAEVGAQTGDVLELPGSSVQDVVLTAGNVLQSITTDLGTYRFTYFDPITTSGGLGSYTVVPDAANGLVGIKLGTDDNLFASVASPTGAYDWSSSGNWSTGVPLNGTVAYVFSDSVDDLPQLRLSYLRSGGAVTVTSGALSVDLDALSTSLIADAEGATVPVSVRIDTAPGASTRGGAVLGATGAGASFENDSVADRGEAYLATDGGTVILYATPAAATSLTFAGTPGGVIALHAAGGTIAAALTIGAGDTIELAGNTVTGVSFGAGSLEISTDLGTTTFDDVTFRSVANGFTFGADASSGLEAITLASVACYVRGTRILTDRGEIAVEDLMIGDGLMTVSGAVRPLRWIGTRSYAGRFLSGNRALHPVLIRQGALGEGLPRRDLHVSPEHAMYLDGVLVPACALIDGVAVLQPRPGGQVEYFHLELDSHDVILAEGAPSESFLDDGSRGTFHNAATAECGAPGDHCAPRVVDGWQLDAVRRRIAARAA